MNELVGRFFVARAEREIASHNEVTIVDHPLNPQLGLLILESVWGARKRDKGKLLLSAGAKKVLGQAIEKFEHSVFRDVMDTNITVAFIHRGDKIPKLIVTHEGTTDIIALISISSGFRGGYSVEYQGGAKRLIHVAAGAAWGESGWLLAYIPQDGKIIVKHTGRLYGKEKYTVIFNANGNLGLVKVDDLSELEVE